MKELLKNLVIFIAVIIIGIIVFGVQIIHYNHGICPNCEIPYQENEYVQGGDSYTHYKCPECGYHGYIVDILKD